MRDFDYLRPTDVDEALHAIATRPEAMFIGGGTNLVDLMREGILRPATVIDVGGLELTELTVTGDRIRVGAGVRNSDLAAHPEIRARLPLISEALLSGASGQVRNMATVGGNLLQRNRCLYFYDSAAACNKRVPGQGCDARGGHHRSGAILGTSEHCLAVHPSDLCVALTAADAEVEVRNRDGARRIPLADFHRLPGASPHLETQLAPHELITAVEIPLLPNGAVSTYRKVADRASFAFALVSIAAALTIRHDRVVDVRIGLGGVATKPWRARLAEAALTGAEVVDAAAAERAFGAALDVELGRAVGTRDTEFKIDLIRRTAVAVLRDLFRRATGDGGEAVPQ